MKGSVYSRANKKEVCHKCDKKEEEERKNTSASLKSRSTKSHVGRQAAAELSVG